MPSVPITTKNVSSNSVHGEVYSIQHYVIKVCHLLQKMNKTFVCSMNNTIGILITLKYAKTILSSKKYYVVLVILDFSVEGIRASRLSPPSLAMGTDLEINLR